MHNVANKPIIYIMHVIEYQHRGLPHAHIVYHLHDPPDKVLRGSLMTSLSVKLLTKFDLFMDLLLIMVLIIYQTYQLHKCAVGFNARKASPDSPCKRWYDKNICTDCTTFNEYGYPVYKRPTDRDLNLVPHNRNM